MQSTDTSLHPEGVTPVKTSFKQEFYIKSALSYRRHIGGSRTGQGGRVVGAPVAVALDVVVAFVVVTELCPNTPDIATPSQKAT
jgi:hypothetical protein